MLMDAYSLGRFHAFEKFALSPRVVNEAISKRFKDSVTPEKPYGVVPPSVNTLAAKYPGSISAVGAAHAASQSGGNRFTSDPSGGNDLGYRLQVLRTRVGTR